MNKNSLLGERKLFLVRRTTTPSKPAEKPLRHPLPNIANQALAPLAFIFLTVVAFAGYACVFGNWERAKDFLLIFLPPITALLGAAATASRQS